MRAILACLVVELLSSMAVGQGELVESREQPTRQSAENRQPVSDQPLRLPRGETGIADVEKRRVRGQPGSWKGTGEFIRSHWVRLTSDNQLIGRVRTYDPDTGQSSGAQFLAVELFQNGDLKGSGSTDGAGMFAIPSLQPGAYSLIARGENGFLAFALHLLPSLKAARIDKPIQLAQAPVARAALEINSAVVPPTFNQLKKILDENYPRMKTFYVPEEAYRPKIKQAIAEQRPGWNEEQGPEEYRGTRQISENLPDLGKTVNAATIDARPVYLTEDNLLKGRLCGIESTTGRPRLVNRSTVYIIRNDRLVTSTNVDERGFFQIKLRRPAVYSLIAAGEDGFGALSFRAERPPAGKEVHVLPATERDSIHLVAADQDDEGRSRQANGIGVVFAGLVVGVAEPIDVSVATGGGNGGYATFQPANPAGTLADAAPTALAGFAERSPFPATNAFGPGYGGGFGPTGYRSGAVGGGPGRLGPLIGAGAIAAGITALAIDDDQLVSPFAPAPSK